jgi:DNA-binding transcriptional ArsR family regulator
MKKLRQEITKKILSCLEEKPLSIQEISKKVGSNWSTINHILKDLREERKVRELFSTKKLRLFKLARDDVYLDIPISKEGKSAGFYIYNKIKNEWARKTGKLPANTDVLKTAVDVLEKIGLDKEIPTVWYLFGKIPLLKYQQEIDYSSGKIENSEKIDKEIIISVENFARKRTTHERMLQQYEFYHNELYKQKKK